MNAAIISLICLIPGFLICTFIPENPRIREQFRAQPPDDDDNTRYILFQRLLVVFFFGILPSVVAGLSGIDLHDIGMNLNNPGYSLLSGFATGAILILINYLNRRNPVNLAMYPAIRKREWNFSLVTLSALSWIVYLFSYEFLFRGFLLMSMYREFGDWNAIAVNVALYSLVHVPKGWKEAAGALPLGIVLCILCLHAGNIWPAFIAHSCLALSNEWFALSFHPAIHLTKGRRQSS